MRLRDALRGAARRPPPAGPAPAPPEEGARCWNGAGRGPLTRARFAAPLLDDERAERAVRSAASFAELLFPKAALGDGSILMQDLKSSGRLFDVLPAPTEGRAPEQLREMHARLLPLLRDVFPQDEQSPWLAQFFVYDRHDLDERLREIRAYIDPELRATAYSRHWLGVLEEHFADAAAPAGFFFDPADQLNWKGRVRRVRLCVWRIAGAAAADGPDLDRLCERLGHALAQTGIRLQARGAGELARWWQQWFGPPGAAPAPDTASPLALFGYGAAGDLAQPALAHGAPWSSSERGCWYFQGRPHRFLTLHALLREPEIGHLTAERLIGERRQALWDRMPAGAVWTMVVAFWPQDRVLEHIARVKRNSVGDDPQAIAIRALADQALQQVAEGNPVLPVFSGVFAAADDDAELDRRAAELGAQLLAHGLALAQPADDPLAQDSYVRALPFNFDPAQDRRCYVRRSRLWFLDHVVRCLPLYGRSCGTGRPGVLAWNRGAEPVAFDPLNRLDRTKNAHAFVFGPTGSGKTAFLVSTLLHLQAVHRPRLYLVTALPTFGLLAAHFRSQGLSVHHVDGERTPIPPFADAALLHDEPGADGGAGVGDAAGPERDLLGEMEIQARLMITGGDPREEARLAREDLNLIRKALLELGARAARAPGTETRTQDLAELMHRAAGAGELGGQPLGAEQRRSLGRMANAVELFCTGQAGRIFNRPGPAWPETDVTVLELGALGHRRNEAWLAVAMTGLLSRINDQVQRRQYAARQTLVVLDEAHLLLKNPLISPYILSISAMWRTFGAWLWIATQSLRQVPEAARELLNQPEWWICMAMERDEVEMIGRFRRLGEEQKAMLLSARKEPGRYTEGVVMSGKLMGLFRNVVPALALALSQTEKDEKARRAAVMREHGCTELEAVYRIAADIRRARREEARR